MLQTKCKKCMGDNRFEKKEKKCVECNNGFYPYKSTDKFCSPKCKIKGSKKSIKKTIKLSAEEKKFKKNKKGIKQKMIDDYGFIFCQNCNTSNSMAFEGHHIVFRSEKPNHRNLHHKKNILIVCIQCHNDFHKEKGMRNEIVVERGLAKLFGNDVLNK